VHYTQQIAHGPGAAQDLTESDSYELFSAMLDGGVPDLELGALLMALRLKTESRQNCWDFIEQP
jgi:anthranilate phosphoribosyltransferase